MGKKQEGEELKKVEYSDDPDVSALRAAAAEFVKKASEMGLPAAAVAYVPGGRGYFTVGGTDEEGNEAGLFMTNLASHPTGYFQCRKFIEDFAAFAEALSGPEVKDGETEVVGGKNTEIATS